MWEIDNSKEARIMYQVDFIEAKDKLLELIEAAMRGEEVAITQDNQPVVKLVVFPNKLNPIGKQEVPKEWFGCPMILTNR